MAKSAQQPLVSDVSESMFEVEPMTWLPKRSCGGYRMCNKDVAKLMQEAHDGGRAPSISSSVAAGMKYAWAALAVLWTLFFILPVLAVCFTRCPHDVEQERVHHGGVFYVDTPGWLWYVYFSFLGVGLWLENKCLTYILAPQYSVMKRITMFGGLVQFQRCPFICYRIAMLLMSVLAHTSIASNGLFAARMWKTSSCLAQSYGHGTQGRIDMLWSEVLQQSTLRFLPEYLQPNFTTLVLVAWVLMLMQLVHAIGYAWPTGPAKYMISNNQFSGDTSEFSVSYYTPASSAEGDAATFDYSTPFDQNQSHGSTFCILAVGARMVSVYYLDGGYSMKKMKMRAACKKTGWETKYLRVAKAFISRGINVFFHVGFLENAVQLNLQISLMAILRDASCAGSFDVMTQVSIVLNILSQATKLMVLVDVITVYRHVRDTISGGELEMCDATSELWSSIRFRMCRFCISTALFVYFVLYAVAKAVALYACPTGLVNMNGCFQHTFEDWCSNAGPRLLEL